VSKSSATINNGAVCCADEFANASPWLNSQRH